MKFSLPPPPLKKVASVSVILLPGQDTLDCFTAKVSVPLALVLKARKHFRTPSALLPPVRNSSRAV